jgi:hypothetical protein
MPYLNSHTFSLALQVGDQLPDATVYEGSPKDAVKVRDLFAGKKGILFGVPGVDLAAHLGQKSVLVGGYCIGQSCS